MLTARKLNGTPLRRLGGQVLALLLLALLQAAPAWAGERVALVIGNSEYRADNWTKLPNAANDAADIAVALGHLGFEVTRLENADRAAMVRGLRTFSETAAGAELGLIFYSGHSIEVDKRNFLIPVDAATETPGSVAKEAVPLDTVLRAGAKAEGLRLIMLDACRNNPFAGKTVTSRTGHTIGVGLGQPIDVSGETLVAYSAKAGTQASDGVGRNSPYTAALLAYLEEPGLEVGLLLRLVRDSVAGASNGGQEPAIYASRSSRQVYFKPPAVMSSPSVSPTGPPLMERHLDLTPQQRQRIQVALWAQGFSPGLPTGRFDNRTREKIAEWQSYYGRDGTGFLDREAADSLLAEVSDPSGPVWLKTVDQECAVWVERPEAGVMTATWSGDCAGGKASGRGRTVLKSTLGARAFEGEMHNGALQGRSTMTMLSGPLQGSRYEGEWENGRFHGHGIFALPSGSRYEGEWRNGRHHGFGKLIFPEGFRYEGEWRNGSSHGFGKLIYPDGSQYEGGWRNGKKHGLGKLIFPDGGRYEGEYKDGIPARRGLLTFSGGSHYKGELNGKLAPHGKGKFTFKNGSFYVGEFRSGKIHGQGIYTSPNGYRYEGGWRNFQEHGIGKINYSNGDRYEGEFRRGKRHGSGIFVLAGGDRYEGDFRFDKFHGRGNFVFSDGTRYEGAWRVGKYDGFGTLISADGDRYIGIFRNGKLHGQGTVTYSDGGRYVGEFRHNLFDGRGIYISKKGDRYEGQWRLGREHGQGTSISSDGIRHEGNYRYGQYYGDGVMTFPEGERHRGKLKNGAFEGRVIVTWLKGKHKGKRAELQVLNKVVDGKAKLVWPDGRQYSGEFGDYDPHGSGTMTWPAGGVYRGSWRSGKPHGKGTYQDKEKRVYEGDWRDGCFGPIDGRTAFLLTTAKACGFN